MKKSFAGFMSFLLAVLMLSSLAGCAKAKPLGVYKSTKAEMYGIEMDVKEALGQEIVIELMEKDKAKISIEDVSENAKWSLNGSNIVIEGKGYSFEGEYTEEEIKIEKYMVEEKDLGITMYFEKQ